jgi:hypothetical protein
MNLHPLTAVGVLLAADLCSAQVPLVSFEGPSAGDAVGGSVAMLGDLDGDGKRDMVVGAPRADLGGLDTGAAWVLSGADGSILFSLAGAAPGDLFGSHVASAGDVNADGIDDIAVGASQEFSDLGGWPGDGPGYAQVYSGADGSLLHMWQGDFGLDTHFNSFGRIILGVGDLNGDGYDDVAVSEREGEVELLHDFESFGGRVWIYSGKDGTVLARLEDFGPTYAHLGWGLAAGRDYDGDGTLDIVLGAPIGNTQPQKIVVVSGATFLPLLQIASGVIEMGMHLACLDDVDDDGVPDIVSGGRFQTAVYSGATGAELQLSPSFASPESYKGLRVAALDDMDGDGKPDYAIGSPTSSGGVTSGGQVQVMSSATGGSIQVVLGGETGGALGESFAAADDLDGDGLADLLIGTPGFDGSAGVDSGLAGIYSTHGPKLRLSVYSPNAIDVDFGQRVAAVGDVDNDGWGDLAAGVPQNTQPLIYGGRVQVFSGRDGSLLHDWIADQSYDRLGWSVDGAGDVNADGYADIIAGAPYHTPPTGPPYARVYSGFDGSILHTFVASVSGTQFGVGVAGIGDIDHDGHDDVAVGAANDSTTTAAIGVVYAFSGRTGAQLLRIPGTSAFGDFGASLDGAGDVDADGTPDLIIGARTATSANGVSSGVVRVHSGANGSLLHEFIGDTSGDQAGWSVAGLGDLNGDGYDDIGYGIPLADGVVPFAGIVRVHSGLDGSLLLTLGTEYAGQNFGQALTGTGDADDDGLPDIAVGLQGADYSAPDAGAVHIYSGTSGKLLLVWTGPFEGNFAGWDVDSNGDLDNDGSTDLLVGAFDSAEDPAPAGGLHLVSVNPQATPWQSLGKKLPGTHGAPVLVGSGSLEPGEPVTLTLTNALEGSVSGLVLGSGALNAPFKGGTLVPLPQFIFYGLPTGPEGELIISAPWPSGVPAGVEVYAQHWIADAQAVSGFAASNAVVGVVP